ncbi:MAG: PEP-CTERM sorting domain-containing protein [Chlorogloea purpurea SAG 13.99]|nr:PEP-CTERM sorting domain-containing protein [Chlorogloea purpurea SAG 13.99]
MTTLGGPTFTHVLLPGSIAIDAGDNSAIPPAILNDQRGAGFPRFINNIVDVGAYEASGSAPPVPEPSSLSGIVTIALVAVGSWRRSKRR